MRKNIMKNRGFTLIELMIVVAIIGILAAVAIPNFLRYQLRAKSAEAAVNMAAIKTSELAYYGNRDHYVAAAEEPATISTGQKQNFVVAPASGWEALGWRPEGQVYFSYAVETGDGAVSNAPAFSATATADLDADTNLQCWVIQWPGTPGNTADTIAPAQAACDTLSPSKITQVYKGSSDGFY